MKKSNFFATLFGLLLLLVFAFSLFYQHKKPYDVVIQSGHEGRKTGNTGAEGKYGKESEWNTIVADETARILRQKGYRVKRIGGELSFLRSRVAVAIHFDGAAKPCSSGASIGYRDARDILFAKLWKERYSAFFPFKWQADNFTPNLKQYYGYFWIDAERFLVLELGEITCDRQAEWLRSRLRQIAKLVALTIIDTLEAS